VFASLPVAQQLAVIFVFLAVFVRVHTGLLDPRVLVWISIGCFLVGYSTWETFHWRVHGDLTRVARSAFSVLLSSFVGL
jgi:phosphatidylinositol N-acetylglucosaminyltransferase subunit C